MSFISTTQEIMSASETEVDETVTSNYSTTTLGTATTLVASGIQDTETRSYKSINLLEMKDLQLDDLRARITYLEYMARNKMDLFLPLSPQPTIQSTGRKTYKVNRGVSSVDTPIDFSAAQQCVPSTQSLPVGIYESGSTREFHDGESFELVFERFRDVLSRFEQYNQKLKEEQRKGNTLSKDVLERYSKVMKEFMDSITNMRIAVDQMQRRNAEQKAVVSSSPATQAAQKPSIVIRKWKSQDNIDLDYPSLNPKLTEENKQESKLLIEEHVFCASNKDQILSRLTMAEKAILDMRMGLHEAYMRGQRGSRRNLRRILGKYEGSSSSALTATSATTVTSRSVALKRQTPNVNVKVMRLQWKQEDLRSRAKRSEVKYKTLKHDISLLKEEAFDLGEKERAFINELEKKDAIIKELKEKVKERSSMTEKLKSRLKMASEMIAQQSDTINNFENDLKQSWEEMDSLKKRYNELKLELETKLAQAQEMNEELLNKMTSQKDAIDFMKVEIEKVQEENNLLKIEKDLANSKVMHLRGLMDIRVDELRKKLEETKVIVSQEVTALAREQLSQMNAEYAENLNQLNTRLSAANCRVHQLMVAIGYFLDKLIAIRDMPPEPAIDTAHGAAAVLEVGDKLNMSSREVRNLIASCAPFRKETWMDEFYKLIHLEDFSDLFAETLFDAVVKCAK